MNEISPVAKAINILRHIAQQEAPVTLANLSRAVGLPKPTAYHLGRVLERAGLISRDPLSRRYQLGSAFETLALSALRNGVSQNTRRLHMENLSQKIGERINLGVLSGGKALYVVGVGSGSGLGVGLIGEDPLDGVVERKPALAGQLVDGHAGEVLVDRPEVEPGVLLVGDLGVPVGEAVGLVKQDAGVLGHEHNAGELIRPGLLIEEGLDGRDELPLVRLGLGDGDRLRVFDDLGRDGQELVRGRFLDRRPEQEVLAAARLDQEGRPEGELGPHPCRRGASSRPSPGGVCSGRRPS